MALVAFDGREVGKVPKKVQTMINIAWDIVGPSSMRVTPHQKQTSTPRLGKRIPWN